MSTYVYAPGKGNLIEPDHASFTNTWDKPCNSNFGITSALVGGTTTIDASVFTGSSPTVTLVLKTYEQNISPWSVPNAAQNLRILVTGALNVSGTILIPKGVPGFWIIDNSTTGTATTLSVRTTAANSTGVNPERGYMSIVFSDGTNVKYADLGPIAAYERPTDLTGAVVAYAGLVVPDGYLPCDGEAVSRTTYADLFAAIGTIWGSGDGSTTFNVPNLADMFLRGSGSSAVGTYEADTYTNHTHDVTDPGHTHTGIVSDRIGSGPAPIVGPQVGSGGGYISSSTTGVTVNTSTTGGTETRPKNKRVLYIIKT